jgi:lysine-ketoglutarate reductase/saccharopine dehydrogenase-like protein (TIGR00300 family)
MGAAVSPERPLSRLAAGVARAMGDVRARHRGILLSAGPAIIHNGGGPSVERLIRTGWIQVLFAGNGLATHDIESAVYGTALGVPVGPAGRSGRVPRDKDAASHHLRVINRVRAYGSIPAAVRSGWLHRGILHACVRHRIPYVLAGSIRDDGPLPGVITDVLEAQDALRAHVPGLGLALLVGSTLQAIAAGNVLPASVRTVCVDINPAAATKLADRGTWQGIGIVADAASFLGALCGALRLPRG